jgi:hypothetical protein
MNSALEQINVYNTFIPNYPHAELAEARRTGRYYQIMLSYIFFLIFIMKINMKEESDFLITHSPLRPLRLCVKNYGVKN